MRIGLMLWSEADFFSFWFFICYLALWNMMFDCESKCWIWIFLSSKTCFFCRYPLQADLLKKSYQLNETKTMYFLVVLKFCSILQIRYFFYLTGILFFFSSFFSFFHLVQNYLLIYGVVSVLSSENPWWWLCSCCLTNWIWDKSREVDAHNIIFYWESE